MKHSEESREGVDIGIQANELSCYTSPRPIIPLWHQIINWSHLRHQKSIQHSTLECKLLLALRGIFTFATMIPGQAQQQCPAGQIGTSRVISADMWGKDYRGGVVNKRLQGHDRLVEEPYIWAWGGSSTFKDCLRRLLREKNIINWKDYQIRLDWIPPRLCLDRQVDVLLLPISTIADGIGRLGYVRALALSGWALKLEVLSCWVNG